MKRTLQINEKPFSINSMYYATHKSKTTEAREWTMRIMYELSNEENKEKLKELREYFDYKKHYYSLSLKFFYPIDKLITKKGHLSALAHDISNIEKPIIDLIFLPKYFKQEVPLGCENLNIDDKYILSMKSEKAASKTCRHKMTISLQIKSLDLK